MGSTTTDASPEQNPLVTQAIADLAARLGVDQSEVAVVSVEEVEWPDASLGCPDPKKSYAQVLVDGYDIVLSESGVEYHYHSGRGSAPFYCAIPMS